MATTVYAKHLPYENGHLGEVSDEMSIYGQPTIAVIEFDDELFAVVGSHRLYLAFHKNIIPKLVILPQETDDTLETYWRKVSKTLPKYEFEHVLRLSLSDLM